MKAMRKEGEKDKVRRESEGGKGGRRQEGER